LRIVSSQVIFPPGAGGLPTMKMGFVYRAAYPTDRTSGSLQYADDNFPGHAGWKEIIAVASPAASFISSSVPQTDRSAGVDQLSHRPAQQPAAAVVRSHPIPLSNCARENDYSQSRSLHSATLRAG